MVYLVMTKRLYKSVWPSVGRSVGDAFAFRLMALYPALLFTSKRSAVEWVKEEKKLGPKENISGPLDRMFGPSCILETRRGS